MSYDQWKTTEPDPWEGDEQFCLIHGYQYMKHTFGNPIAYCTECERDGDGEGCEEE